MKHLSMLVLLLSVCACGTESGTEILEPDAGHNGEDAGKHDAGRSAEPADSGSMQEPQDAAVRVEAVIKTSPSATLGADGTASFTFECDAENCSFECAWDDGVYSACTSPASKSGLADGEHTFHVRAVSDGATQLPVSSVTFKVDAVAPSVTMDTKPGTQSNAKKSSFVFACSEQSCSFECSFDAGSFSACAASNAFEVTELGSHTLKVRARDAAGNVSAEVAHTWKLEFGFRSLAVAESTACAVSGARKLYCWGSGRYGLLGDGFQEPGENETHALAVPTDIGSAEDWDSVVAGPYSFCARNVKGERYCWGTNYYKQFGDSALTGNTYNVPTRAAGDFPTLKLGEEHGCAIDSAQHLYCWGEGEYGKLGDGNIDDHQQATPLQVGTAKWKAVAISDYHNCGVQTNGTLYCFGENDSGECGQPEETESIGTPTQVGSDSDWVGVAAGEAFSCGLKSNGAIYCWGGNWSGELGNGTTDSTHNPVRVGTDSDWVSVSAHGSGACATKSNGQAFCWGSNELGQLGRTDQGMTSTVPTRVAIDSAVTGVYGKKLRCALTSGDQVLCWGDNVNTAGGLGRGIKGAESDWFELDSGYTMISISRVSYGEFEGGGCGIKQDGKLYCWGLGNFVGLPNTKLATTPTLISEDSGWTAIDVLTSTTPVNTEGSNASGHACGIRAGELYCWGRNDNGQLGLGDTDQRNVPTKVTAVEDPWSSVSVGAYSTCAITTTKKLYCWGRNSEGQLAQGDSGAPRPSPNQVGSLTEWDKVTVNGTAVVALRENGTIWRWGWGSGPVLAQADGGNGLTPSSDWIEAKPFSNGWCGIKTGGAMFCRTLNDALLAVSSVEDAASLLKTDSQLCGKRTDGRLFCLRGTGSDWVESTPPYPVAPSGTDWVSIELSSGFGCGLKADGRRLCKGPRRAGSFGDGTDERVPMAVTLPQ